MAKDGFGEPYRHWAEAGRKAAKPQPFLAAVMDKALQEWQAALAAKVMSAFSVTREQIGLGGRWPYGTIIAHPAGSMAMYVGRSNLNHHEIIRLHPPFVGNDVIWDTDIRQWEEIDG